MSALSNMLLSDSICQLVNDYSEAEAVSDLCGAEQLVGERCSEKADIYSLGVVLWELCTLDTPMLRQTRDIM